MVTGMNRPVSLSVRALNRALLARQHLLNRTGLTATDMVEHLVGMQGQAPLAPYVGLWSRLDGFATAHLAVPLQDRRVVRASLLRGTIHLATARDALAMRPLLQPVVARGYKGAFGRLAKGVDLAELVEVGIELLDGRARTRAELRSELAERWPGHDAEALSYGISYLVPAVQVTPRGIWGQSGAARLQTIESWLGSPLDRTATVDRLVRRYLAAFGPASVMDAHEWSGLTRLGEVFERLRPGLRIVRSPDGAELFDLPDAPRPEPETPAPVRFLPEYDNLLLSHADRTRVIPDGRRVPLPPGIGATAGTVLIDGTYQADWRLTRDKREATLHVTAFRRLSTDEQDDVEAEGLRLAAFAVPDAAASVDLRFDA